MRRWLEGVLGLRGVDPGASHEVDAVRRVLDMDRALLRDDGGDVEVVRVADGRVELRMTGACGACPAIGDTVARVIEPRLRRELAWVREVRVVG